MQYILMCAGAVFVLLPLAGFTQKDPFLRKFSGSVLCFDAAVGMWLLTAFFAPAFAEAIGFWPPFAVCGGLFLIGLILIWKPFTLKSRRTMLYALGAIIAIFAALSGIMSVMQN
ncbi:MAG: hypothetical protein LBH63_01165 [Clostridiales Family XIII bacterium]|jgi:hypothetical protein|nr:hypothetical protein [Clostridiales Family XIII bacterium]